MLGFKTSTRKVSTPRGKGQHGHRQPTVTGTATRRTPTQCTQSGSTATVQGIGTRSSPNWTHSASSTLHTAPQATHPRPPSGAWLSPSTVLTVLVGRTKRSPRLPPRRGTPCTVTSEATLVSLQSLPNLGFPVSKPNTFRLTMLRKLSRTFSTSDTEQIKVRLAVKFGLAVVQM